MGRNRGLVSWEHYKVIFLATSLFLYSNILTTYNCMTRSITTYLHLEGLSSDEIFSLVVTRSLSSSSPGRNSWKKKTANPASRYPLTVQCRTTVSKEQVASCQVSQVFKPSPQLDISFLSDSHSHSTILKHYLTKSFVKHIRRNVMHNCHTVFQSKFPA